MSREEEIFHERFDHPQACERLPDRRLRMFHKKMKSVMKESSLNHDYWRDMELKFAHDIKSF